MSTPPKAPSSPEVESQGPVNAVAVIERMKQAFGVTADAALAAVLGTSKQNISKWKMRNSIPYAEAVLTSIHCRVPLDFIIFGDADKSSLSKSDRLDKEIIKSILNGFCNSGVISIPNEQDRKAAVDRISDAFILQYDRTERVIAEMISKGGFSEELARSASTIATELLASEAGKSIGARRGGAVPKKDTDTKIEGPN